MNCRPICTSACEKLMPSGLVYNGIQNKGEKEEIRETGKRADKKKDQMGDSTNPEEIGVDTCEFSEYATGEARTGT